jgi:hypothetical protein
MFIKDGIHILVHTCRCISLILHNSRICYLWCISSQIKKLLQLTPHCYINSFFQQLKYLDVYHKQVYVFLYNYINVIWCHNLNFGLTTKAKAWKGACQECNPWVTFALLKVGGSVWRNEPTHSQMDSYFGSWNPKFSESDCKGQN